MGDAIFPEDVHLKLSLLKGQDEQKVQEEEKVQPARVSAQMARRKISERMESN